MRDPYEVLGVDRKASAGRHQERLPAACEEAASGRQQERPEGRLDALPSSMPRTKSSARKTSAKPSTAARSTPRASRASTASRDLGAAAGAAPAASAPESEFETFSFGPEGFTRSTRPRRAAPAAGGLRRYSPGSVRRCGRSRAPWRRPARRLRGGGFRRRSGRQGRVDRVRCRRRRTASRSACTCPAARISRSRSRPASPMARQIRLRGQGMAGPGGAGDVLITVSVAPHPIFTLEWRRCAARFADHARRGGARRQGTRPDPRPAGRAHDPALDQQRPHLPPQGQGLPGQGRRTATSSPRCASCCRNGATPSSRR